MHGPHSVGLWSVSSLVVRASRWEHPFITEHMGRVSLLLYTCLPVSSLFSPRLLSACLATFTSRSSAFDLLSVLCLVCLVRYFVFFLCIFGLRFVPPPPIADLFIMGVWGYKPYRVLGRAERANTVRSVAA